MNSKLRPIYRTLIVSCLCLPFAAAQEPPPPPETPAVDIDSPASPDTAAVQVDSPNWSDRRNVFFKKLYSPQAILETVPGTAFDTARGFPRQWGRGGLGISKRLGSQYGQFVVGETIELGVSALHREDPRYFRMPGGNFGPRLWHALASAIIVRGADGSKTIGLARLANVYGSWAIATSWNPPDQRNFGKIAANGTLGLGIKAGSNVFSEFWPDVKRRLARH